MFGISAERHWCKSTSGHQPESEHLSPAAQCISTKIRGNGSVDLTVAFFLLV